MQSFTRRIGDELAAGIAYELRLDEGRRALATAWAHGIVGMVQAAGDHWLATRDARREDLVARSTGLLWGEFASMPEPDADATVVAAGEPGIDSLTAGQEAKALSH